jgi:amino acid permease
MHVHTAVSYAAFGLAAAVYATVMCAGYATFGQSASGLILNNYHKRVSPSTHYTTVHYTVDTLTLECVDL